MARFFHFRELTRLTLNWRRSEQAKGASSATPRDSTRHIGGGLPGTQNRWFVGRPKPLFEVPEPSTHPIMSWIRFSSNSRERFAANGRHRHPENLNFPNGFLIILGMHSTLRVFRMSHLKTTTLNTLKTGNKYQKGGAEF